MKKTFLVMAVMALCFGVMSCNKTMEEKLLGTWGVERIEYYYIDYYGQPIESTMEVHEYVPGDFENGIELAFLSGHKGKWYDHDVDTILVQTGINPVTYDTIVNPDTTLVTPFTYSFDKDIPAVFLYTTSAETYMLLIEQLDDNTLIYSNEYKVDYVEHAILKRVDGQPSSKASGKTKSHASYPRKPGSLFSHELVNEKH